MNQYQPIPHIQGAEYTEEEMIARSQAFYSKIGKRRTIRDFSDEPIPVEVINNCLMAAGTAPNGANRQPWHFAVVSDRELKRQIRKAAEKEEQEFYKNRAPQEWLDALAHLGTDENKAFLEQAPYLIAIFSETKNPSTDGFLRNYYVSESVGIATGVLITALHDAGLASLTHTPSPMHFLNKLLGRPKHEKPFLLLVVGKPSSKAMVPTIKKKSLNEFVSYL